MPNLYSIQFEVLADPERGADVVFEELRSVVSSWARDSYRRKWNLDVLVQPNGEMVVPVPKHSLQLMTGSAASVTLDRLRWVHPDDKDDSRSWVPTAEDMR